MFLGAILRLLKMMVNLGPHERLDDLVLNGMKVIQRDDQFCFSLDTVLLAQFGSVPHGKALDLGTGTGAIPLILAARGAKDVIGVELNPIMADIARRNVTLNGKEDTIHIRHDDYCQIRTWSRSGEYAAIYANPPYREKSRGAYSDVDGVRRAKHEETASLEDVLAAVQYALKFHGRFRMVHITERLPEILGAMAAHDLAPKVLQFIHGRPDKPAKLFLVEAIRGGSAGVSILPPLIVHHADGSYSETVNRLYGKE